jgi:hypothetical protein
VIDGSTGGNDTLVHIIETEQESDEVVYDPYPDYNSAAWKAKWKGAYQQCVGPSGALLDRENKDLFMKGYRWNMSSTDIEITVSLCRFLLTETGFPKPVFGSYEAWNLDNSLCTDRYSQYGAYGYGNETREIWANVNLGKLQQECLQRNAERYQYRNPAEKALTLDKIHDVYDVFENQDGIAAAEDNSSPDYHSRTAVILRSWINKVYTANDIHFIRSMVMELSLLSGAEYEVILLIDSTGTELPNPADLEGMDRFKKDNLPEELQDIAVFFNEKILADWYPKIDVHM